MPYCVHYIGDLSQPLHNTLYDDFNKKYHVIIDGMIDDEILDNIDKIPIYPILIMSEQELATEVARIADLSLKLGYRMEKENRLLTREEAYIQVGHSASLLRSVLEYLKGLKRSKDGLIRKGTR